MTTEIHQNFPTILLQCSMKITYEVCNFNFSQLFDLEGKYFRNLCAKSPPGIKKNIKRTYENWTPEFIGKGGITRSQALFGLSWFHAVMQERRNYIPQVQIPNTIFSKSLIFLHDLKH
jgi:dynein heavy chain 2